MYIYIFMYVYSMSIWQVKAIDCGTWAIHSLSLHPGRKSQNICIPLSVQRLPWKRTVFSFTTNQLSISFPKSSPSKPPGDPLWGSLWRRDSAPGPAHKSRTTWDPPGCRAWLKWPLPREVYSSWRKPHRSMTKLRRTGAVGPMPFTIPRLTMNAIGWSWAMPSPRVFWMTHDDTNDHQQNASWVSSAKCKG